MFLCRKKKDGSLHDDLIATEDHKQHWPHKAKSKTGYSQNAFHRGQYANFSIAANGSSGVVLQIQTGLDQVTWRGQEQCTCSNKKGMEDCTASEGLI